VDVVIATKNILLSRAASFLMTLHHRLHLTQAAITTTTTENNYNKNNTIIMRIYTIMTAE